MPKTFSLIRLWPDWLEAWSSALHYEEAIGLLHGLIRLVGSSTSPVPIQNMYTFEDRNTRIGFMVSIVRDSFERLPLDNVLTREERVLLAPESEIKCLALRYALRLCNIGLECGVKRHQFLDEGVRASFLDLISDRRLYRDDKVYQQPIDREIERFLSLYYHWYMKGSRNVDIQDSFLRATVMSGNAVLFEDVLKIGFPTKGYLSTPENFKEHLKRQAVSLGGWIDDSPHSAECNRSDTVVELLRQGQTTIAWKNANQYLRIREALK